MCLLFVVKLLKNKTNISVRIIIIFIIFKIIYEVKLTDYKYNTYNVKFM